MASSANWSWRWRWRQNRNCCCSTSRWPASASPKSARMVALLKELRKEVTIVLVEHDMEAVFALADRITVLVYGRVIACDDAGRDPEA